jgi:hypothetical protein
MTYRTSTIKRERRSAARIQQLDGQIVAVLREDHPQSCRHVFYRMTNPRLPEPVEKSDRGYRHVQHRLTELRRSGAVPYAWVSDMTRRGYFVDTFNDTASFLREVAGLYRADLWRNSACRCEVWVESRSIAGVIETDCRELAVSLYPCGGFSSISFAHSAAESINASYDGRPVVVLYIGDHDPAGVLIDVALERELRTHLKLGVMLEFRRIGITVEQIAEYDLPGNPRKVSDRRSLHVAAAVEAEAMPAHILRNLLRQEIEAMLPPNALAVAKAAEISERKFLNILAQTLDTVA